MSKKFYTAEELEKKFDNTTRVEKINILSQAIDYMQQYNGRTKQTCIFLAMGYDYEEVDKFFKIH
jgi:hypothetical protein